MLNWVLSRWSWKSFAIGMGAAVFGGTVARPVLVGAVKTGMDIKDRAAETLQGAKAEAERIRSEAMALRAAESGGSTNALIDEIRKLREEVSSLKSSYAPKA
jgi:hypothetical protein